MPYQVLARKWRPQRFEGVVGQRAVTQTLRNAIRTGRIAQAFVFSGPRGVGKTTTARILARALNCVEGPTPEPCGRCEACVEIAEGRDMDVLEIDAATNTKIEDTRAVIIEGLAIPPARDRYKIFIIDEVHQLSNHSFNALLKSIEEPPPHALFVMATTEVGKIPETIISRSQVFEFRTIPSSAIAEQLRKIADAEGMSVSDEALALVARAADGSMRDAQTSLDQVIAFAGGKISVEDVSSVLGLVGRDLLLDTLGAVADQNAAAAFELAGRAVEAGYDLRLLCRELARVVRDLMVLDVDPSRISDTDVAPEGERERLKELGRRFSREDLLRAFDVLTRAEADIRSAAEPRYHLEMALLRWMHLRQLAPLAEIIKRLQADPSALRTGPAGHGGTHSASSRSQAARTTHAASGRQTERRTGAPAAEGSRAGRPAVSPPAADARPRGAQPASPASARGEEVSGAVGRQPPAGDSTDSRQAFLAAIEQARLPFYRTVVAQAQRIEFGEKVLFVFSPVHRLLKEQVEQNRAWLEAMAERVAGRRVAVATELAAARAGEGNGAAAGRPAQRDLRAVALEDSGVRAMLEVFPAEIRSVEEIRPSRGGHRPRTGEA